MTKTKLLIVLILVTGVACGALFFVKDKAGKPLITLVQDKLSKMSLADMDFPFFNKKEPKPIDSKRISEKSMVPEEGQDVETFYTYKDEKGVTHVTNQKPNRDDYKVTYIPQFKDDKGGLEKIKDTFNSMTSTGDKKKNQVEDDKPVTDPLSGQTFEDAKSMRKHYEAMSKEQ